MYILLKYRVTNVLKRIWGSDKCYKKKLKVFGAINNDIQLGAVLSPNKVWKMASDCVSFPTCGFVILFRRLWDATVAVIILPYLVSDKIKMVKFCKLGAKFLRENWFNIFIYINFI